MPRQIAAAPGDGDEAGSHPSMETSRNRGFVRSYTYDDALRPIKVVTEVDGLELVQDYVYGGYHGHLEGIRYPSGEILALDYDRYGYLQVERRNRVDAGRRHCGRRFSL
jgi:YD repeat-containing protein